MKMMNNKIQNWFLIRRFWLLPGIIFLPLILKAQTSEFNYATGQVKGRNYVGGLIGRIAEKEGTVRNSYARGSVTGETQVGGLAGSNTGTVEKTYAAGKVTGNSNAGGLAGSGGGTVTASYWDLQTSGQSVSAGGAGRNTDPMTWPYASDTYSGWDFTSIWKADQSPFQNGGYPMLTTAGLFQVSVQVYPPGAGTVSGEGYYLSGQQAQLGITTDNRYVFKGWMRNSALLSTGLQYSLKVAEQTSLVARFESKTTAIENDLLVHSPKLKIYPNPVRDVLWVDFSSLKDEVTAVALDNLAGQRVKMIDTGHAAFKQISIDVSGLKPGIYIIHALQTIGYCSEKFVKY
jgi:hypothetical protein